MQGTRVGSYTLVAELGSGGMGTVWKGEGPDGAEVAIKVVHPHLVEQQGFRERFDREARSGLAIGSRNVVRTLACLETEVSGRRVPALVLEFVRGRDLAALAAESGHVPEDLCRHLAREIARGLEAVHAAGIVHRDMKPANVLLTDAGDVKVMDLGLARQASGEDRMSQTGLFLGTAAYAPPEQFFGRKDLDPRSDLYSLGAMLFELATGRVPFEAEGIGELVRKVLRDKAPRIGTLAPQTTPFFEELVATLLEKDADRRFASAAELGEVLDAGETGDWWAAASMRLQMESGRPLRRVRTQRETALWGREDDLAELRSLWDRAKNGRGGVVLLEGEAGIGKTRLVEEFLAAIESEDAAQVLTGRHDPSGAGSPAEALAAAFREHLGSDDLDARLAELLPETPDLVPAFAALLRGAAPPAGAPALGASAIRTLFVHLARSLSKDAPLVLVVDDLHFAGDEGRALFRAVALAVESDAVLLVGTARPGLPAKWSEDVTRRDNALRHEVKRLDENTVRAALAQHLGATWEAQSVAGMIASQAGGNPYFVVEALRHLGERGNLSRTADGAWRVTVVPAGLALPATVREVVAARLANLAAADRDALEAASCQGAEFDGRLVAETLARPRMEILRALGRLEQVTRLVRAAGMRFAFDHHVVHEVLYGGQDAVARTRRHAAIGAALEARQGDVAGAGGDAAGAQSAVIARHLLLGGEGARAVRHVVPGLDHLDRTFANQAALELADLALGTPGLFEGAARAALLLRLCQGSLDRLALRARQEAAAREAEDWARGAGDGEAAARAASALGWCLLMTGRLDEAVASFQRVQEFAATGGAPAGGIAAAMGLGSTAYLRGRHDDAMLHYRRALELAGAANEASAQAGATINLGNVLHAMGRLAEAREHHTRGLALARRAGHRHFESNALSNLGIVASSEGRYDDARAHFEAHVALARAIGDRSAEATALLNVAVVFSRERRLADSIRTVERSLAACRETGDRFHETTSAFNAGNARAQSGDFDGAEPLLVRALELAREFGVSETVVQSNYMLGRIRMNRGDLAGARPYLEAARDQAAATGFTRMDAFSRCLLARFLDGDAADAARRVAALAGPARRPDATNTGGAAADGGAGPAAAVADTSECNLAETDPGNLAVGYLDLWRATHDPAHLAEARRLVDVSLAPLPPDRRAAAIRDYVEFGAIVAGTE